MSTGFRHLRRAAAAALAIATVAAISACSGISDHSRITTRPERPPAMLATSAADRAQAALPPLPSDPAGQSRILTHYLHAHRLPLVGASVTPGQNGREVVLYGYTATEYGRNDAEGDALRIINDPHVAIINRVVVKPELLAANQADAPSAYQPSETNGGAISSVARYQSLPAPDTYQGQVQQYESQSRGSSWTSYIVPILMFAMMFVPL